MLKEEGPMDAMAGGSPMGGAPGGMPAPGGMGGQMNDPMGGMGAMGGLGGNPMGGMGDPMGGMGGAPMGGAPMPASNEPPVIPRNADVWDVLDHILNKTPLTHDEKLERQRQQPASAPPEPGAMNMSQQAAPDMQMQ